MRHILWLFIVLLCAAPLAEAQFRALRLSGAVTMQDGSPPPEPVLVRLECPNNEQPQAYTDKDGKFLFSVGGPQSLTTIDSRRSRPGMAVGAEGPDRSHVSMTGCMLRALLPGYTSTMIDLGRRSVFESTDVGTIVLKPAGDGPDPLVSVNTLAAPDKAAKAYEKAQEELAKEHPNADKAAKELEKAVDEYPEFTAAWNLLGEARIRNGDLAGASIALKKASELEPKYAPPYVTLALMELQQGQMREAEQHASHAVGLHPDLAEAHYYRAIACSELGEVDKAEESIRAIQENGEGDRYPRIHFLMGNIHYGRNQIPEAAKAFERYLELEPESRAAGAVREQLEKWKQAGLTGN